MSSTELPLTLHRVPPLGRLRAYLTADSRRAAQIQWLGVSLGVIGLSILGSTNSEAVSFLGFKMPPLCPFRAFTGFDCPGCGITRALIYAFHGRFYDSYMMHLWGIPLALLLVAQIPYRLFLLSSKRQTAIQWPLSGVLWNRFVALSVVLPWLAKLTLLIPIRFF